MASFPRFSMSAVRKLVSRSELSDPSCESENWNSKKRSDSIRRETSWAHSDSSWNKWGNVETTSESSGGVSSWRDEGSERIEARLFETLV